MSDGSWRINVKDGSETAMCLDWYCQSGAWSGSSVKTVTRVNSGYETISVSCNSDEHLTGGGAQCNPSGKERLKWSNPNGNGWAAACPREELTVFAICSSK